MKGNGFKIEITRRCETVKKGLFKYSKIRTKGKVITRKMSTNEVFESFFQDPFIKQVLKD